VSGAVVGSFAGVALADFDGGDATAAAAAVRAAAAMFGGAAAGTGVAAAGAAAGATVGVEGVGTTAALFGNTVSAESAEPIAVGAFAAVDTALEATCVCAGKVLDEPPRNIHANAATSASAETAIPIIMGILDGDSFDAAFAVDVDRNCIGSNGAGSPDCARPSLAKRSSAVFTSSIGSAMLLASCDTDIGCESRVRSFLWRTESPAAPILFGSVASAVALHKVVVSNVVDMNGST